MYLADTCFIFKCQRLLRHVCPSVCLHETEQLPLDEFPWNFMLGTFKKICRETPNLWKMGKNMGHFTWRPKYVLSFPVALCHHNSALFQWDGIRLLEQPTRYKCYANVEECYVVRTLSILLLKHCSPAMQSPSNISEKLLFLGFNTGNATIKASSIGN